MPDGRMERVGDLAVEFLQITPRKILVYAIDLADRPEKQKKLVKLASRSHSFFGEASFAKAEVEQARRTEQLSASSYAEIANAAEVEHLVLFHFSRRYEKAPERFYEEVKAVCAQVLVPR